MANPNADLIFCFIIIMGNLCVVLCEPICKLIDSKKKKIYFHTLILVLTSTCCEAWFSLDAAHVTLCTKPIIEGLGFKNTIVILNFATLSFNLFGDKEFFCNNSKFICMTTILLLLTY